MEKFYLGLDIGTDSAGIACTDENYVLLRAKGKDLWATRLFDPAKDAKERRTYRIARRRTARRKERIALLQALFAPFMEDAAFFLRLKNSAFYEEDKEDGLPRLTLFADADYTDKQFYAEYPTIFHLRRALIEKGASDLRLYYLALHHIIKYRGHFLFEGESIGGARDLSAIFEEFNAVSAELFEEEAPLLDVSLAERFLQIALDGSMRMNDKKRELQKVFGASPRMKEIVTFLLGGKGKPAVLFEDCGEEKGFSLEIADEEFDAKEETLGDAFALFGCLRKIFRFVRFEKILNGRESISQAMTGVYDKHRADLKALKKLLSAYYPHELYVRVFKSTHEGANYANYIGYTKPNRNKIHVKKCKYEDFTKYLLKALAEQPAEEEGKALWKRVTEGLAEGTFLPKILNADNGVFPHQINLAELDGILKNLCRDFPAFAEKGEDGLSPAQKIRSVFLFRIPYFVGPLNRHAPNAWVVRREEGRITPWNFEEKVDLEKSNEEFIRRMTGKCSYLHAEDVLPKCSMYYEAFDVLNQLNKLRINGEPVSVALKQELFRNLFLADARITDRKIAGYLISHGYAAKGERVLLTGKEGDFKAGMRSYVKLKEKLGGLVDERPEVCEDIILWHTLCTDKGMVENYLLKTYGDIPAIKENIKWIKGLTLFKDFGNLSKKFLCALGGGEDPVGKGQYTILGALYHTNLNLNEILYDEKYSFRAAIRAENGVREEKVDYDDVKELYIAPQVRRGIWQALEMTDEYVAALGRAPDKIFVEVTRENDPAKKGKRTEARKAQLLALLQEVKEIEDLKEELNGKSDRELRQERLYLYFRQLGKCMYTGKKIDLLQLDSDLYDVDHILPQSLVKDDSLENKVLVLRTKNKEKADRYPLPAGFTDQQPFWKLLHEKKLIGDEKWARLTRKEPLTDADYEGFVNRQLVYTNQMAKAVAELLQRKFEKWGTKIIYSKAGRVSDFRQKFHFVKCRETNDLHHARDAYLNIVVGNVYDTRFTALREYFYRKTSDGSQRQINLDTLFTYDVAGAWDKGHSLEIVRATMAKSQSIAVTRYAYCNSGAFYDQTVYPKGDDGIGAPRKGKGPLSDPSKYGGYKSLDTAYFAIVRSKDKKGALQKTIEAIPVLVDYRAKNERGILLAYLRDKCGLTEPEILIPRLRIKTLVKVNGTPVYLAGITGSQIILHNAVEWFTDGKTDEYVKALGKLLERARMGQYSGEEAQEIFVMHTNRFGEVKQTVDRPQNVALYDRMLRQLGKPIYGGISGAVFFRGKVAGLREKFLSLSVLDQAEVLMQIAKFLKCNAEGANLQLLGDKAKCGILLINKKITDVDFRIVDQSPCGLDVRERKV